MKLEELMEVHSSRRMRDVRGRPRTHEEKHCLRKARYPTLKEARFALLKLWKKGRPERSLYQCDYCKQFHLTSRKPSGIAHT